MSLTAGNTAARTSSGYIRKPCDKAPLPEGVVFQMLSVELVSWDEEVCLDWRLYWQTPHNSVFLEVFSVG